MATLSVTPADALVDEPRRIVATGLQPGELPPPTGLELEEDLEYNTNNNCNSK